MVEPVEPTSPDRAEPGPAEPERTEPERTADGRYPIVNGRRWRASDPSIPDPLRAELVAELMRARRAVGAAKRSGKNSAGKDSAGKDSAGKNSAGRNSAAPDSSADNLVGASARPMVQDAKVALGERGEPWWDAPSDQGRRDRLAATIRALLRHRVDRTICPSDAARAVGGEQWRELMPTARDVAAGLQLAGEVQVCQGGEPVDPETARGPIRLAAGPELTR